MLIASTASGTINYGHVLPVIDLVAPVEAPVYREAGFDSLDNKTRKAAVAVAAFSNRPYIFETYDPFGLDYACACTDANANPCGPITGVIHPVLEVPIGNLDKKGQKILEYIAKQQSPPITITYPLTPFLFVYFK